MIHIINDINESHWKPFSSREDQDQTNIQNNIYSQRKISYRKDVDNTI